MELNWILQSHAAAGENSTENISSYSSSALSELFCAGVVFRVLLLRYSLLFRNLVTAFRRHAIILTSFQCLCDPSDLQSTNVSMHFFRRWLFLYK
jgi:hypothetical protein